MVTGSGPCRMLLKRKRKTHWTADISSDSASSPTHDPPPSTRRPLRPPLPRPHRQRQFTHEPDVRRLSRRRSRAAPDAGTPASSKAEAAANSSPAPAPRIEPRGSRRNATPGRSPPAVAPESESD
ncbi:hypothetical protein VPH35_122760 [Triticum aestivum]